MALVIETGAVVDGANSYVTAAEAEAYALARGVTLSNTEVLLTQAMDYLESLSFVGNPVATDQPLSWPRDNLGVPKKIKQAQMQLAIEASKTDLMPSVTQDTRGRVIEETIQGAVTKRYAHSSSSGSVIGAPVFPKVDALLKDFISSIASNGRFAIKSYRA